MNQFVILSFGVDPLNWQSFIEIGDVAHLPGAPMDSLLRTRGICAGISARQRYNQIIILHPLSRFF